MADDVSVPSGTRYDALRLLGVRAWSESGAQLCGFLGADVAPELQMGAISGLSDMNTPEVAAALIRHFPQFTESNRSLAAAALLRDPIRIEALLDAVAAKALAVEAFDGPKRARLFSLEDERLRSRARILFGN